MYNYSCNLSFKSSRSIFWIFFSVLGSNPTSFCRSEVCIPTKYCFSCHLFTIIKNFTVISSLERIISRQDSM